jgi:hypothetical protein
VVGVAPLSSASRPSSHAHVHPRVAPLPPVAVARVGAVEILALVVQPTVREIDVIATCVEAAVHHLHVPSVVWTAVHILVAHHVCLRDALCTRIKVTLESACSCTPLTVPVHMGRTGQRPTARLCEPKVLGSLRRRRVAANAPAAPLLPPAELLLLFLLVEHNLLLLLVLGAGVFSLTHYTRSTPRIQSCTPVIHLAVGGAPPWCSSRREAVASSDGLRVSCPLLRRQLGRSLALLRGTCSRGARTSPVFSLGYSLGDGFRHIFTAELGKLRSAPHPPLGAATTGTPKFRREDGVQNDRYK